MASAPPQRIANGFMPPLLWDANKTVQYTCTGKAALAAMCCCWCGSCCWELMAAAGLWQLCPAAGRQAPCVRCLLLATELIRILLYTRWSGHGTATRSGDGSPAKAMTSPRGSNIPDIGERNQQTQQPAACCVVEVAILSKNVTTFSARTNKLVTNDLPTDFSSNSKPIRHVTKFPVRMPIITMDHLR